MRTEVNPLPSPAAIRGNGEIILLIEDEPDVREMIRRLLEFRGFRTLVAENGSAGLALYREHLSGVHAIVTDMRMPDMSGTEVIYEIRRLNPNARIVVMSGVVDHNYRFLEEPGRLAYLPKPMTSAELVHAVQSVLDGPPPSPESRA